MEALTQYNLETRSRLRPLKNPKVEIRHLHHIIKWCSADKPFYSTIKIKTGKMLLTLKRHPHKMVKHTQTIRRLLPTNCLSVFDHFVELALKELRKLHRSTNVFFNIKHLHKRTFKMANVSHVSIYMPMNKGKY